MLNFINRFKMKIKNYFTTALMLFSFGAFALNSCTNAKSEQKTTESQTNTQNASIISVSNTSISGNSIKTELEKAKKEGKAVFLVVSSTDATDIDKATKIAKDAKLIYKNSLVLQMNRDDKENADLVAQWQLSSAPVPLILVFSTKGLLTGGRLLADATAENIAVLVPSPKLELVYEAIANKKHAIVVFTKKSFTDKTEVIKIAKQAVVKLGNEAIFVEIDMDDNNEIGFMNQMRIDKNTAKASVTIVINSQGQVAGTSTTIPSADKLVAAAKTPVKGGCGPGCGPAGCGQ